MRDLFNMFDPQATSSQQPGEPPTFAAFRTADGIQLAFWCDWCERLHYHGACGPEWGEGNGHRGAHCIDPASPYRRTGYFIREVTRVLWVMQP
jgi:hypothetical protein